jgi:hypothetical protein
MRTRLRLAKIEAEASALAPDENEAIAEVEELLGVSMDELDGERLAGFHVLVAGIAYGLPIPHDACESWHVCGCPWCSSRRQALDVVGPEYLAPTTQREALAYLVRTYKLTPEQTEELAAATPEEIEEALAEVGVTL